MWPVLIVAFATAIAMVLRKGRLADTSLRISRWTYGIVFPLSLLYFPVKGGGVHAVDCEWTFDWALAVYSLRNFNHLVGFIIFFLLTFAQLRGVKRPIAWSLAASLVMGFLVEIAEGATSVHHCRMRDLVPDMAGACIGAIVIAIVRQVLALRRPERAA